MNVQMSDVFFSFTFPEAQKVLVTLTQKAARQLHWHTLKRGDFYFITQNLTKGPETPCASWLLL